MSAGTVGTSKRLRVNGPEGGGDALQGLPPICNMRSPLVPFVRARSDGSDRNLIFCVNQLGGVGAKRGQFGPGNRAGVGKTGGCQREGQYGGRYFGTALHGMLGSGMLTGAWPNWNNISDEGCIEHCKKHAPNPQYAGLCEEKCAGMKQCLNHVTSNSPCTNTPNCEQAYRTCCNGLSAGCYPTTYYCINFPWERNLCGQDGAGPKTPPDLPWP